MKAVYVGAGVDLRPVNNFKNIKTFYYIDCQPFSEFGVMRSKEWKGGQWTGKFDNGFSRPNFIPRLDKTMTENNMKLVKIEDNVRTYTNGNQTIHYYTNTSMPEHYEDIKDVIKDFNVLIVAGHDPHGIFLDATKNIKQFIGYENTSYFNDKYDPNHRDSEKYGILNEFAQEDVNNVIYNLHNGNIQQKFSKFTYVEKKKIYNFVHWDDFYMHSKKDDENENKSHI